MMRCIWLGEELDDFYGVISLGNGWMVDIPGDAFIIVNTWQCYVSNVISGEVSCVTPHIYPHGRTLYVCCWYFKLYISH